MTLNLAQHRGEPSVWDASPHRDVERWLVGILAGACLAAGLRRRSPAGLLLTLGGSGLVWWAAGGIDQRQFARRKMRSTLAALRPRADVVTEAAEESFPASDPPAWTPTIGAIDSGGGA